MSGDPLVKRNLNVTPNCKNRLFSVLKATISLILNANVSEALAPFTCMHANVFHRVFGIL